MPRVEEKERNDKPQDIGGGERYNERKEELVLEEVGYFKALVRRLNLNGSDGYKDGGENKVEHEGHPEIDHGHVELVGPLRPVPKCEYEACEQGRQIKPLKDDP